MQMKRIIALLLLAALYLLLRKTPLAPYLIGKDLQ